MRTQTTFTAQFNCFELTIPADVVRMCYHQGDCTEDVQRCLKLPEVKAELARIAPEKIADELREYGAWDDAELANHDENLQRILWIAVGNIQDEQNENQ